MDALTGRQVALRPVTPGDVDDLVRLFEEPEVTPWWPRYDRTRIEDKVVGDDEPETTVYVIDVNGELAGLIQSSDEDDPDYRAAWIDIAVATRWHGKGVAVDALRTLARHLIEADGHHHLFIDPAAANTRAVRCYEKVGFRPVGIMRQNERGPDGTFHDALLMDMLAGELTLG